MRSGLVHHIEIWVPNLKRATTSWGGCSRRSATRPFRTGQTDRAGSSTTPTSSSKSRPMEQDPTNGPRAGSTTLLCSADLAAMSTQSRKLRPARVGTCSSPTDILMRAVQITTRPTLESNPAQRRESRQCCHPHGPATSWLKVGRIIGVAPPEVRSIGPQAAQPAPLPHRPARPTPANNIERSRIARLPAMG